MRKDCSIPGKYFQPCTAAPNWAACTSTAANSLSLNFLGFEDEFRLFSGRHTPRRRGIQYSALNTEYPACAGYDDRKIGGTHPKNRGSSGKASLPPWTCTRPSSAQRCRVGNTFPGLSNPCA